MLLFIATASWADFTPVGAEAEGNAEGTIPRWTGGLAGSHAKHGTLADLFPGDRPEFFITSENFRSYADHLAAGHQALLTKYADYAMPVYATRRTVSFPDNVYRAIAENAQRARLKGVDAIEGAQLGIPFPRPNSGVELLWNHRLRYRGDSAKWRYARSVVHPDGSRQNSEAIEHDLFGYANANRPLDLARDNRHSSAFIYLRPATGAYRDISVLWRERVNEFSKEREIWTYGTELTRVYRNPPIGDDDVGMFSEFIRYWDMMDMFNGGFFRYGFKLLGKREIYVPYNSYRLNDGRYKNADLLQARHFNQVAPRYELHRVWIVEANLRSGEHHSISRRVFYIDEDSWSILLVDCYDSQGALSRFQEGHLLPLDQIRAVDYAPTLTYDLADGRYFADRLLSETPAPQFNIEGMLETDFSTTGLVAWHDRFAKKALK